MTQPIDWNRRGSVTLELTEEREKRITEVAQALYDICRDRLSPFEAIICLQQLLATIRETQGVIDDFEIPMDESQS